MPHAQAILDREYLDVRAKILELAAALDRLDRADGSVSDDPRLARIHHALQALLTDAPDRAAQVQLIFSLPYDPQWQAAYDLARRP